MALDPDACCQEPEDYPFEVLLLQADDLGFAVQFPPPPVRAWVERFGRRGTEPNELFRSEFGQNSWNLKKKPRKATSLK